VPEVRFVYLVRCNFGDAARERAFNDWYSGPKLRDMLAKPYFASGQRFEAVAGDTAVRYCALWALERADALETPEYNASWGFADWAGAIHDWTRDLCELERPVPAGALACPPDGRLRLVADHDGDGLLSARTIGLDRSVDRFGLEILRSPGDPEPAAGGETLYRPLVEAGTP
jgi:hypothetical protein